MGRILYVDTGELRSIARAYRAGAETISNINSDIDQRRRSLTAPVRGGVALPQSLDDLGHRAGRVLTDTEGFLRNDAGLIDRLAHAFDGADRRGLFGLSIVGSSWSPTEVISPPPELSSRFEPKIRSGLRSVTDSGRRLLVGWTRRTLQAGRSAVRNSLGIAGTLRSRFTDVERRFRNRLESLVASAWNRIWSRVTSLFGAVRDAVSSLVQKVADVFKSIGDVLSRAGRWVVGGVKFLVSTMTDPGAFFRKWATMAVYEGLKMIPFIGTLVSLPELLYRSTQYLSALGVEIFYDTFQPGSYMAVAARKYKEELFGGFALTVFGAVPFVGTAVGVWELMDTQRGTVGDPPTTEQVAKPRQVTAPPSQSAVPVAPLPQGPYQFSQRTLADLAASDLGKHQPTTVNGSEWGAPGQCIMWVDRWLNSVGLLGGLPGGSPPFEQFERLGGLRVDAANLQPGDIFQRAVPGAWGDLPHTAIVKSYNATTGEIVLIEGNKHSDGNVEINPYRVKDLQRAGHEVRFYRLGQVN